MIFLVQVATLQTQISQLLDNERSLRKALGAQLLLMSASLNKSVMYIHTYIYIFIRHIGERIIRGCASAVLRVCNMIELVHAELTHTYAAIYTTHCNTLQHIATHCNTLQHICRHPTTLRYARGPCYGDGFTFSDFLEPPEEGRGIGSPRKHIILADCTT